MKKIIFIAGIGLFLLSREGFAMHVDPAETQEQRYQRIFQSRGPGNESPHGVHYSDCVKRAHQFMTGEDGDPTDDGDDNKYTLRSTRGTSFYYAPSSDRRLEQD